MPARPVWLNPPSSAWDESEAPVLLKRKQIDLLVELLRREKSEVTQVDRRALVVGLLHCLEQAGVHPGEATVSRESPWHPATQLGHLLDTVPQVLTRWTGGTCVVLRAVQAAAGVEADRRGWDGVEEVAAAAEQAAREARSLAYGRVRPPHWDSQGG